ncbi:OSGI2 inhibitor, partial [Atractosteus spatula]|nr:OSGI2 inhibitor [Atractosteus spatula]
MCVTGNGPSGICLSYLLSGYTPYLAPGGMHPNPFLLRKLEERPELSLLDQDLGYLCEGLEGRSSNPVAVLFDSLLLPDGDFGSDCPSPLQWRHEPGRAIPHLVLGKGPPGGAWHAMEDSMLTLSLANWMELPGLKLKDWIREKRRNLRNDRATPAEIASYYQHYVTAMGLQSRFAPETLVTSLRRVPNLRNDRATPAEIASYYQHYVTAMGLQSRFAPETLVTSLRRVPCGGAAGGSPRTVWEVQGVRGSDGRGAGGEPFSVRARSVVLATGTQDVPARLGAEGEDLPFVAHSFLELEAAMASGQLGEGSAPVLVVGAGLTAADAVLVAHHFNIPVYHAFRRAVSDPGLIFNQLPKVLYPEYHKVHQMMTQQQFRPQDGPETPAGTLGDSCGFTGSYPGYLSFPRHRVVAFRPDRKCVLEGEDGRQTVLQVSMVLVLIGSHPSLSFLPHSGRYLGVDAKEPISCRRNPVDVDPFTHESLREPGLYALGPLVGENFVRFLKGGALAVASDLAARGAGAGRAADGEHASTGSLDT